MASVGQWKAERQKAGEQGIYASTGLHYGEVVLGDIGVTRLEFALIGNTVNVASRLEALTRKLGVSFVASDDLVEQARSQSIGQATHLAGLQKQAPQEIRGVSEPMKVWTL